MKKIVLFVAFIEMLLGSAVHSNEQPQKQQWSVEAKNPNHIYFGPEFLCLQLNTHVKDIKVHGTRFFWGFRIGYEYLKPKAFYAGIDLLGTSTETDFNASKHGHHVSWHKADRGFGNLEIRFGYTFAPIKWLVTPFLGVGAYDIFAIDHYNHQGFKENFFYATAGVHSLCTITSALDVGFNFKFFRTIESEKRFKYEGGKVKKHDEMWGGEVGVPIIWHIGSSKRWDVQLEPYFLKLDFSEVQNVYGTRLLFGYRF